MAMINCRGDFKLGTACGKCSRCLKTLAANSHCPAPSGSEMSIELDRLGKVQISRVEKVEYGSRSESLRITLAEATELHEKLGSFLFENTKISGCEPTDSDKH